MEIYRRFIVTKIPKWFFILFFSARNICFWSVMLRFDEFFFFLHNVPENVFFFYSGTSGNGSTVFKNRK